MPPFWHARAGVGRLSPLKGTLMPLKLPGVWKLPPAHPISTLSGSFRLSSLGETLHTFLWEPGGLPWDR